MFLFIAIALFDIWFMSHVWVSVSQKKLFNFITYEFFSFLFGWDMMGSATITTRIQWRRGERERKGECCYKSIEYSCFSLEHRLTIKMLNKSYVTSFVKEGRGGGRWKVRKKVSDKNVVLFLFPFTLSRSRSLTRFLPR